MRWLGPRHGRGLPGRSCLACIAWASLAPPAQAAPAHPAYPRGQLMPRESRAPLPRFCRVSAAFLPRSPLCRRSAAVLPRFCRGSATVSRSARSLFFPFFSFRARTRKKEGRGTMLASLRTAALRGVAARSAVRAPQGEGAEVHFFSRGFWIEKARDARRPGRPDGRSAEGEKKMKADRRTRTIRQRVAGRRDRQLESGPRQRALAGGVSLSHWADAMRPDVGSGGAAWPVPPLSTTARASRAEGKRACQRRKPSKAAFPVWAV